MIIKYKENAMKLSTLPDVPHDQHETYRSHIEAITRNTGRRAMFFADQKNRTLD